MFLGGFVRIPNTKVHVQFRKFEVERRKTVYSLAAPTEDASCNAMSCVDLGAQGHDTKASLDKRVEEYCRLIARIQSSIKT